MPRTIGTAAQKVDAIRLTTALATTAGQAIACRKLSILALIVPVLIAGLEHSIYLHSREDQSWPEHMRRREMTLAEEAAHFAYFRATFRMRDEDFRELYVQLQLPTFLHVDGDNPKKFSGVTGLLVLLARLGCTGAIRVVASMLRMDHKRVGAIVLRMVRWISTKWSPVVRNGLIPERFAQYAESIRHSSGIRNLDIFCFIDCTVRGCARPLYGQEAIYGGHKKKHGLKYQALATPDGLIVCLFGPDVCRHHDLRLLADSALLERIEALQQATGREWLIYGDPAYVPGQALITGFSRMERASNAAKDWFEIFVK